VISRPVAGAYFRLPQRGLEQLQESHRHLPKEASLHQASAWHWYVWRRPARSLAALTQANNWRQTMLIYAYVLAVALTTAASGTARNSAHTTPRRPPANAVAFCIGELSGRASLARGCSALRAESSKSEDPSWRDGNLLLS